MPKIPTRVPDLLKGAKTRVIVDEWGKVQEVPTPLAFQHAEYVVVTRCVDLATPVEGTVEVPCIKCNELCWRSPSSPARIKALCTECLPDQMAEARKKADKT